MSLRRTCQLKKVTDQLNSLKDGNHIKPEGTVRNN